MTGDCLSMQAVLAVKRGWCGLEKQVRRVMGATFLHLREERRRHKRFLLKETVYVLLDSQPLAQAAEILDLSMGGMGLHYFDIEGSDPQWQWLDVLSPENFFLQRLPIQIVSKRTIDEEKERSGVKRLNRCGVKFVDLSLSQEVMLDMFLQENSRRGQSAGINTYQGRNENENSGIHTSS